MTNIDDYLKATKYSDAIKNGGLQLIIKIWKDFSDNILDEDMDFFEYLDKLYIRDLLKELMSNCIVKISDKILIAKCDEVFRSNTCEVLNHISGMHRNLEQNRIDFWWHYRIPKNKKEEWKIHLPKVRDRTIQKVFVDEDK